jgi:hypothetical protein
MYQSRYGFLPTALLEALELVMFNNRMRFGDIIVKQISGISMGMSPAPTIANLFMAIYEAEHVLRYIPSVVLYLRGFIHDGLGVWLHDPDPTVDERNWKKFQDCLNASGLWWIFSTRSWEAVFMDLWLKIEGKKIVTSLYAKPMALHLYLPPHSCHAPGVLSGLVFGNVLRIHQLCSNTSDVVKEKKQFLHHLFDQGYQLAQLTPLFQKAVDNAKAYLRCIALDHLRVPFMKQASHHQRVFLHLPYHPANPSSKTIQKLWLSQVATPWDQPPLSRLTNKQGYSIPIERLTIACAHPTWATFCPTGNHITARGLKVSSFIKT